MKNLKAKQERGYIVQKDICLFSHLDPSELLLMLLDEIPNKRTIAATILGIRKEKSCISNLIKALTLEVKLYPKIAISESIGKMGKDAVKYLIPHLGIIGTNQHTALPNKPFLKSNYPLSRDIIARTIGKIGCAAIPILMQELDINNRGQLSEGIDAIGYISYYYHNSIAKNYLLQLFKNQSNDIIIWKLIRSFQSFSGNDLILILNQIIKKSNIQPFIWEAKRSLKQIQKSK